MDLCLSSLISSAILPGANLPLPSSIKSMIDCYFEQSLNLIDILLLALAFKGVLFSKADAPGVDSLDPLLGK